MKIEKDIADLDSFIKGIEPEVVGFLDERAHQAVALQQAKSDYQIIHGTFGARSDMS